MPLVAEPRRAVPVPFWVTRKAVPVRAGGQAGVAGAGTVGGAQDQVATRCPGHCAGDEQGGHHGHDGGEANGVGTDGHFSGLPHSGPVAATVKRGARSIGLGSSLAIVVVPSTGRKCRACVACGLWSNRLPHRSRRPRALEVPMTVTPTGRLTTDEILAPQPRVHLLLAGRPRPRSTRSSSTAAEGIYFWDPDGKRYIDFNSQLMSINIGHGNQRVADAIAEQAHKLAFAAPQFATEVRGRLGELLAEVTPGDLNKFFFTLGGAEANENALRMARIVTGRQKVIAYHRSYHGATAGAISVTGDPRRWANEPGVAGRHPRPRPVALGPGRAGAGGRAPRLHRRGDPVRGAAHHRRLHHGDGHRHERHPHPAGRLPRGDPRALHPPRDRDDLRRGDGRLRPHRAAGSRSTTGTWFPT